MLLPWRFSLSFLFSDPTCRYLLSRRVGYTYMACTYVQRHHKSNSRQRVRHCNHTVIQRVCVGSLYHFSCAVYERRIVLSLFLSASAVAPDEDAILFLFLRRHDDFSWWSAHRSLASRSLCLCLSSALLLFPMLHSQIYIYVFPRIHVDVAAYPPRGRWHWRVFLAQLAALIIAWLPSVQ